MSAVNKQPAIDVRDLSFHYEPELEPALQRINLSVAHGEWIALVGPNGTGKTTLCRLLCGSLQSWPGARLQGSIHIGGIDRSAATTLDLAGQVGAVYQNPDDSLIQEYVVDELAFGPENLRVPPEQIDKRIEEALNAVGMEFALSERIFHLSGGQQQRIAIASMLSMRPGILIFDEAAANLDMEAEKMFKETLLRLHRQGHTIVTTSSRLDTMAEAERIVLLDQGRIVADGSPAKMMAEPERLIQSGCLPDVSEATLPVAVTLSESASPQVTATHEAASAPPTAAKSSLATHKASDVDGQPLLHLHDIYFAYGDPPGTSVLTRVNLELYPGDVLALLGPNGTGKTTLGKLLAGSLRPQRGSIRITGRVATDDAMGKRAKDIAYIFQQPEHQFVADTVLEECNFALQNGVKKDPSMADADYGGEKWLEKFDLARVKHLSPYELSDVQKRFLNLASVLVAQPAIVILDEPTAGLDYKQADRLLSHCADYAATGKGIILISHDMKMVQKWASKTLNLEQYS